MSGCVRADSSLKIVKVEVSLSCVNFAGVVSDSGQPYYCLYLTNNKLILYWTILLQSLVYKKQVVSNKGLVDLYQCNGVCVYHGFSRVCQYGVWSIKDCDLNRSIKC